MRKIIKKVIKPILFVVIFILISCILTSIFTPKLIDGPYRTTKTVANFYLEQKNSLDVLYLGTSLVEHGISPFTIWEEYGIPSYSIATGHQPPIISYYFLVEALKYQKPKVIVLDCNIYFKETDYDEDSKHFRKVLDYMPLSFTKIQAILEITNNSEHQSAVDYLYPFARYHSRWESLTEADFQKVTDEHSLKGVDICYESFAFEFPKNYMQQNDEEKIQLSESGKDYLDRIIKLCDYNGISFVLISMPHASWNFQKHQALSQTAEFYKVPFIDYNLQENRRVIQFNSKYDYYDAGDHLNIYGAEKVSRHLGAYLHEHYNLKDKRSDPYYNAWNNDLKYYKELTLNEAIP